MAAMGSGMNWRMETSASAKAAVRAASWLSVLSVGIATTAEVTSRPE
jgi:hypothetical protein